MTTPATPRTWLSPAEAAERLGRSRKTIERAIKDGSLPSFKWRGCRMLDANAVDRAVKSSRNVKPRSNKGPTSSHSPSPNNHQTPEA